MKPNEQLYNERGQRICGYVTPSGPCRNPTNCRFHQKLPDEFYALQQSFKLRKRQAKKSGIWTEEEHNAFLDAIKLLGIGRWKEVAQLIGTRTSGQCQVHFYKIKQRLQCNDDQFTNMAEEYTKAHEIEPPKEPIKSPEPSFHNSTSEPLVNKSFVQKSSSDQNGLLPFDDLFGAPPSLSS